MILLYGLLMPTFVNAFFFSKRRSAMLRYDFKSSFWPLKWYQNYLEIPTITFFFFILLIARLRDMHRFIMLEVRTNFRQSLKRKKRRKIVLPCFNFKFGRLYWWLENKACGFLQLSAISLMVKSVMDGSS